jgi:fumarylacetoacetate (FAA) hydrolase
MKLATYKDGSRDGMLVVVSRDLTQAVYPTGIANTLQAALDDWNFISPQLQDVSVQLNHHKLKHAFPFDPSRCMAPLPRAYQWADGSAFINHVELVRLARKSEVPANYYTEPLMYQGGSDDFLGPMDDIVCVDTAHGIDFEAELAVITGDVPMQTTPEQALESIRLVMLANDLSLRHLIPDELAKSFGFLQSKPATAFSPVAVTPDELASPGLVSPWRNGRLHLTVSSTWNGQVVGRCDAGEEMTFHFGQLIAHLCKTRNVSAGSVIGSGTISNRAAVDAQGQKTWPLGYSCIAEQRAIETILHGIPITEYMQFNDTIKIEMLGTDGLSIFGAIDQVVKPLQSPHV